MSTSTALRYPLRTRIVVLLVLAVAVAGFVVAGLSTDTDDGSGVAVSGADGASGGAPTGVERRIPGDGDEILGQETIGIDLAPGWTGELLLLPGNGQAVQLPSDEVKVTALNELLYQPGEGKTVERLSGDYCVAATIWDQVRGREASERVETWCFAAT